MPQITWLVNGTEIIPSKSHDHNLQASLKAGLHTNFFSWWPDRATKIINYQFLVARTGNLVARKKSLK